MAEEKINELIYKVLAKAKNPLTAGEIAEILGTDYPHLKENEDNRIYKIKGLIGTIFSATVGETRILRTGDRPAKLYLNEWNRFTEDATQSNKNSSFDEHDMYDPLINFLKNDGMYCMTTDKKGSGNITQGSKWLHPDIVGIKDVFADVKNNETIELISASQTNRFNLYSFEVKNEITVLKARETFYQAMGNSSWANYSYIICANIENNRARSELKTLCESFGIGLLGINFYKDGNGTLLINEDDFEEIVSPKRKEIDITLLDKLADKNPSFKNYLKKVVKCYKDNKIDPRIWVI